MMPLIPSINPHLLDNANTIASSIPLKNDDESLKKVGQQFGELMMKEILKSALKPMGNKSGLFNSKQAGGDIQFGLLVDTMAQAMAQGQSFGFDELLTKTQK